MSVRNDDLGDEIRRLVREVVTISGGMEGLARNEDIQAVRQKIGTLGRLKGSIERCRSRLVDERRWVRSEIHGFEKALVLVGSPVGASGHGGGRLVRKLESRVERLAEVGVEIDEIEDEIGEFESDIEALQVELIGELRDAVVQAEEDKRAAAAALWACALRNRRREMRKTDLEVMWSPTLVHGYRMWIIDSDGFRGSRELWQSPTMSAACSAAGDLPHTDGRCAAVAFGCGVYAAKSVETLMKEMCATAGSRFAVGVVGLGGKVVEHDRGYRAQTATVRALAVVERGSVRVVHDDAALRTLFENPSAAPFVAPIVQPNPKGDAAVKRAIQSFLEERVERYEQWI